MIQIKYFCNLCNEQKQEKELYCFYWDSTLKIILENNEIKFGGYSIIFDINKSDKHICKNCSKIIKETN